MINQMNSGGAVGGVDPLAQGKAYSKALAKYNPKGAKSSPYGTIAGSAISTLAKGMAANPKLAAQVGDSLRKYFSDEQAPAPVEDKSTPWSGGAVESNNAMPADQFDPAAFAQEQPQMSMPPEQQSILAQLLQQGQPQGGMMSPMPQQSLFGTGTVPMQPGGGY